MSGYVHMCASACRVWRWWIPLVLELPVVVTWLIWVLGTELWIFSKSRNFSSIEPSLGLFFMFCFSFLDPASCSPRWPRSHCIAEHNLDHLFLLPPSPGYWLAYRDAPWQPAWEREFLGWTRTFLLSLDCPWKTWSLVGSQQRKIAQFILALVVKA